MLKQFGNAGSNIVLFTQHMRKYMVSGQISSRPHTTDFPQKVAFWKGNPLISGKSRLVKYYNLARWFVNVCHVYFC